MVIGGAWEWHRPCTLRLFASTGSVIHPFVLIELSSGDRGLRSLFRPADVENDVHTKGKGGGHGGCRGSQRAAVSNEHRRKLQEFPTGIKIQKMRNGRRNSSSE
eukprot:scaffold238740_cov31-Tisochrysis_lutea.AAC.1